MRKLVKDSSGNVAELLSLNGSIPGGWEEVPVEELESTELSLAKANKMIQIRAERDRRLVENDRQWLIASKTGQPTTTVESAAQTLRDLPEAAETALNALTTVEDIKAYDAFAEL